MAWLRLADDRALNLDYCVSWDYSPGDAPPVDTPEVSPSGETAAVSHDVAPVLQPPTLVLHATDAKRDVTLTGEDAVQAHAYLVATSPSA